MTDGRITKGQETRNRIIFATLDYIADNGLKSLSASKIAKLAGVSKSNVFHHFESVEVIPLQALEMIAEELIAFNKIDDCKSVRELLLKIGSQIFCMDDNSINMFRSFFVLYNEAFHDERYNKLIIDIKERYGRSLEEAIIELNGDIYGDLTDYCQLIGVMADGFGCHFLTDLNIEYYMRLWEMQVDMLIKKLETLKKK